MGDFELHKLTHETLGEYLTTVRQGFGWTVEKVAGATGITPRFLQAIECGNFAALPEPVYVVGFIKKLGAYYKVPADELVAQFYREARIAEADTQSSNPRSWKTLATHISPLRFTLLASFGGGLLFVGVCVWQILAIGKVPALSVISPQTDERVSGGLVNVSGTATPGSQVELNGQTVYSGSDGHFSSTVSFFSGAQVVEVTAKSRFGKKATKRVTFVVDNGADSQRLGPAMPRAQADSALVLASAKK
jgi:transcriptional regulator with XRE-family HTH domain